MTINVEAKNWKFVWYIYLHWKFRITNRTQDRKNWKYKIIFPLGVIFFYDYGYEY